MKNSKFVFDKISKILEQGLISSRDLTSEMVNILKSKRDEIVFKMKVRMNLMFCPKELKF